MLMSMSAMVHPLGDAPSPSRATQMWKLESRKRYSEYAKGWVDTPAFVREDDVSLMPVGQGREKQLYFTYSDNEVSFKFTADRWSGDDHALADTWFVLLDAGLNRLENETGQTVDFAKAREIAENIEDGLLAWPWYGAAKATPAKAVRFSMTTWRHWSPDLGWGE